MEELQEQMKWVRSLARALLKDAHQADDLVQDAWVQALAHPRQSRAAWKGWFSRVMRNRAAEVQRDASRHDRLDLKSPSPSPGITPQETALRVETQQAVSEVVLGLPEPYRAALLLHYYEGWSLKRIAARDGVDVRAIEARLRRAREKLLAGLEQRGPIERWAFGLVLLAGPLPLAFTGIAVACAAVAVLLLVAFWPFTQPDRSEVTSLPSLADVTVLAGQQPTAADASVLRGEPGAEIVRAQADAPTTHLRIRVLDQDSKAPVAGVHAHLVFQSKEGEGLGSVAWVSENHEAFETVFPQDAVGFNYGLETSAGFLGVESAFHKWGDRPPDELALYVSPFHGDIRGRVLNTEGLPIAGAEVGVWHRGHERKDVEPLLRIPTLPDGSFVLAPAFTKSADTFLAGLAPGWCASRTFSYQPRDADVTSITGIELVLEAGHPCSVRVEDEFGAPVAQAVVSIWPWREDEHLPNADIGKYERRIHFHLTTDETGALPTVMVSNDRWQIVVNHPAFTDWRGVIQPTDRELVVRLPALQLLTGTVRGFSGELLAGVKITVESQEQDRMAVTNESGQYAVGLAGALEDEVRLILRPPSAHAFHVSDPFRPAEAGMVHDFTLGQGFAVAARLLNAEGALWSSEGRLTSSIRGGDLRREPAQDERSTMSLAEILLATNRSPLGGAEVTWTQLPAGDYVVSFFGPSGLLAEGVVSAGGPAVDLIAGRYLTPRTSIEGRVIFAPTGAPVTRFAVDGTRSGPDGRALGRMGKNFEDAEGRFRIEGLEPGTWSLRVYDWENRSMWGVESIQLTQDLTTTLAPSLDEAIDGVLTVLHAAGTPASNFRVRLLGPDGLMRMIGNGYGASTGTDGTVSLTRIPKSVPLRIEARERSDRPWIALPGTLDPYRSEWEVRLPE